MNTGPEYTIEERERMGFVPAFGGPQFEGMTIESYAVISRMRGGLKPIVVPTMEARFQGNEIIARLMKTARTTPMGGQC